MKFEKKVNSYVHGWGPSMADPKAVICSWVLPLTDIYGKPHKITFDIVEGDDPLVIGDNILKHSNHIRLLDVPQLEIKMPGQKSKAVFNSYTKTGEDRPRLLVVEGHKRSFAGKKNEDEDLKQVLKVHQYSHSPKHDNTRLFERAGQLTPGILRYIDQIVDSCSVCVQSNQPAASRKVSSSNIYKGFNEQ